mmetsp:Transcript_51914/g.161077  ORF Transcript_51914/g.161077 Transcript_51914/m.161077 type:complete len:237 (+) Transcript_51914:152-862(+)
MCSSRPRVASVKPCPAPAPVLLVVDQRGESRPLVVLRHVEAGLVENLHHALKRRAGLLQELSVQLDAQHAGWLLQEVRGTLEGMALEPLDVHLHGEDAALGAGEDGVQRGQLRLHDGAVLRQVDEARAPLVCGVQVHRHLPLRLVCSLRLIRINGDQAVAHCVVVDVDRAGEVVAGHGGLHVLRDGRHALHGDHPAPTAVGLDTAGQGQSPGADVRTDVQEVSPAVDLLDELAELA